MTDVALLNSILRVTWAASNYRVIVQPVQQAPYEVDHFIEVQHFTAILISVMKDLNEYNNWQTQPIGYFIDLATFVNEHRNLFQISKTLNQQKKGIKFEDYRTNAVIQGYLAYQVQEGTGRITVKASVLAMLNAMIARNTAWSKYTSRVGTKAKQILGW